MADAGTPEGAAPTPAPRISVVIPVHNEEAILVDTVGHVMSGLSEMPIDSFEIILCENGSSDTTTVIGEALAHQHPEVRLLTLERPDYGAAMKMGFLAATGEIIVNFDADYYNLDFLSVALSTDAEIVVAAKGILGSHDTRVFIRRVASRTFGWFVRRMVGVKVAETHGMKLMHRAAVIDLVGQVLSTKDLFDTELLVRAERSGLRIRELPITTEELRHSRSGILRRIPRTIWGLIKMRMLLRRHRPMRINPVLEGHELQDPGSNTGE